MTDPRRTLPSVDRLLRDPAIARMADEFPPAVVTAAIREVLAEARKAPEDVPHDWPQLVTARVRAGQRRHLQPVVNATGVILHTNLGRAPLAAEALAAIQAVGAGYSTLEFDLDSGARGSRLDHAAPLLAELSGAEAALVVNNAAGALVLALNAVADGREVLLSRGELIEIGGSFRIPDILAKSGAILREVGTTNRTHVKDYAAAIGPTTGAILTVHRSNFVQEGFVATPAPAELATLAREHRLPYLHDIGSGLVADLAAFGLTSEPRVPDAVAAGADLVLFSGDKLLGGPQAGCLVGRRDLIETARRNPFARAVRADKFTLAALQATLALYRDPPAALRSIPVLRMLTRTPADLEAAAAELLALVPAAFHPRMVPGNSAVGGGAFPGASLPTTLVALDPGPLGAQDLARRLRLGAPPVIVRIAGDAVLFDPRTFMPEDIPTIGAALATTSSPLSPLLP